MFQKVNWIKRFEPLTESKLKEAALETAEWIEDYGYTETGNTSLLLSDTSLYGGTAGVALFYLRLYIATGDKTWLVKAKDGIDYVISKYHGKEDFYTEEEFIPGAYIGLYGGPAGGAYVADQYYEITGDETYKEYAIRVAKDCIAAATQEKDELFWYGTYGIIGEGSLILFLTDLYKKYKDEEIKTAATLAANYIYNRREDAPGGGYRWYAMPTDTFPTIKKAGGYFPGFEYGTAGCGFIFADLYEANQDERFLEAAKKAAEYVMNIADYSEDGNAALVKYNDPYLPDLYYLGVCQGPVGTSRLFFKLYQITGEQIYKDFVVKLTNGLLASGAPTKHSAGYWRTNCYCCGAPGMLEHFINVYKFTKDQTYLDAAYEAAETIIGDSTLNNRFRMWYTAWNRHEPDTSTVYTGLYHGSGGCASSLLTLAQHISGGKTLPPYLEDPYKIL